MYHLYKSAHHQLARLEIGYHAIAQRTDSAYIWMFLLIHKFRLGSNSYHIVVTVKGYDGRFVNSYLVITDNNSVGCSKVHGYFLNKRKESHS